MLETFENKLFTGRRICAALEVLYRLAFAVKEKKDIAEARRIRLVCTYVGGDDKRAMVEGKKFREMTMLNVIFVSKIKN